MNHEILYMLHSCMIAAKHDLNTSAAIAQVYTQDYERSPSANTYRRMHRAKRDKTINYLAYHTARDAYISMHNRIAHSH